MGHLLRNKIRCSAHVDRVSYTYVAAIVSVGRTNDFALTNMNNRFYK